MRKKWLFPISQCIFPTVVKCFSTRSFINTGQIYTFFPTRCECSIFTTTHIQRKELNIRNVRPNSVLFDQTSVLAVSMVTLLLLQRVSVPSVCSERGLAEDFMVGVEGEGGGERSDVGDERGVLEWRQGGRQEGQLAHFTVGRAGRVVVGAVRAAGAARFWGVVLLRPEPNHLTEKRNVINMIIFCFLELLLVFALRRIGNSCCFNTF